MMKMRKRKERRKRNRNRNRRRWRRRNKNRNRERNRNKKRMTGNKRRLLTKKKVRKLILQSNEHKVRSNELIRIET